MIVRLNNKDYIWSYIGVFVSVGSSALLLPFILYYLTDDMYGLWSVFQSVASITVLFDFGFSTTFARNINYCWCGAAELKKTGVAYSENKAPNFVLMKKTMTACRVVFLLLSLLAFFCMLIPGTAYIRHICDSLFNGEVLAAWLIYVAAIFLNLYYGYFSSFLRGVGAISHVNRVTVISRLVQIIATILLLMCGCGIVGTGIAYLLYGFVLRILSRCAFMRFHGIGEGLSAIKEKTSRDEVRELFLIVWHNASKEGIVTLSNYLANQACTIIGPLFVSLKMIGTYSLAVQLATVLSNVAGALYTANQPVLQSAYISNDEMLTKRTMSLIVVSYTLLYGVGSAFVVLAGLPILRLIKPDTTPSVLIMLGVGFYQFMLKFRNCYTSYFSCTNRILYARAFIVSSVFGVVQAMIYLNIGLGIWGLILAQIISQGIYNVWYWPLKAHREMALDFSQTIRYGIEELKKIIKGFVK